jgi:hypothetical protein
MITLYRVEYRTPAAGTYRLDTCDPEKIGNWVAEMYRLFPWNLTWPDQPVRITTGQLRLP